MKPSYYNVVVDLGDNEHLLYNTHTEGMVVLSDDERASYDLIAENDYRESELDDNASALELFKELQKRNFILDDPETEASWIEYEYEKYKFNNRLFELIITPTLACNFCCEYCYERKRPGVMSREVQDAIVRFVEESYDDQPFKEFRVTWYGGEPLLSPSTIEYLSEKFLAFCHEHNVAYHAALMTNGSLADESMMKRMYACGIKSVQVTFGGKGEIHDNERKSVDGSSSYQKIYDNTQRMLADGTAVHVEYVFDADNLASCIEVAEEIGPHDNIFTHFPYPKMDYNNEFYDENGNCKFSLQTPEERAFGYRDIIMATKPDAIHWHQLLDRKSVV